MPDRPVFSDIAATLAGWLYEQAAAGMPEVASAFIGCRTTTRQYEADVQLVSVDELANLARWAEHLDLPVRLEWVHGPRGDYLDARIRIEIPAASHTAAIEIWTHLDRPTQYDAVMDATGVAPDSPVQATAAELRRAAERAALAQPQGVV